MMFNAEFSDSSETVQAQKNGKLKGGGLESLILFYDDCLFFSKFF